MMWICIVINIIIVISYIVIFKLPKHDDLEDITDVIIPKITNYECVGCFVDGTKVYKTTYGEPYRDIAGNLKYDKYYELIYNEPKYLETTTLDDNTYRTYCTRYETDLMNNQIVVHKSPLPVNCKNCGAPLHSHECEYCGSEYY